MSFKSSLVKLAIKMTPNFLVRWIANIVLKGFAELTEFNFDIDTRTVYIQVMLHGETEAIDVWVNDFAIVTEEGVRYLTIHEAQSNKPWLHNLLHRITGKTWKIPVLPQFENEIELVSELFKAELPAREAVD